MLKLITSKHKEHIKSLIFTFITDFLYSILLGLATLVQTQDVTTSALVSVGYAGFRTALRPLKDKLLSKISSNE